jgi:hypothetical protein
MKTKEEIEQLADEYSEIGKEVGLTFKEHTLENIAFINGYTQCQEDMAEKIKEAYEQGLKEGYSCMPSINSLNKQD